MDFGLRALLVVRGLQALADADNRPAHDGVLLGGGEGGHGSLPL